MSGKRRGQSGPDGESYSEALGEKVPNDPEGRTWGQILHSLDEKDKSSEARYYGLTQSLSPEDLENLPYPEPIRTSLGPYENPNRKEFWTKARRKIWPHLTEMEKKVFLRIIHTPKIQSWEIAQSLKLTTDNIYVIRDRLEKKIRRMYGNS